MTLRRIGTVLMLVGVATTAFGQDQSAPPESAAVAAAYALIAPDVAGMPVRLDLRHENDALIIRVTKADVPPARARRARSAPTSLEARITQTPDGDVAAIEITGEVAPKARVRLDPEAPDTARRSALRGARYGPGKNAEVKEQAVARAVRTLGRGGSAGEPTLVWESIGAEERPVWAVPLQIEQKSGKVGYVARFDAVDGALIGVAREGER